MPFPSPPDRISPQRQAQVRCHLRLARFTKTALAGLCRPHRHSLRRPRNYRASIDRRHHDALRHVSPHANTIQNSTIPMQGDIPHRLVLARKSGSRKNSVASSTIKDSATVQLAISEARSSRRMFDRQDSRGQSAISTFGERAYPSRSSTRLPRQQNSEIAL